MKLAYRHQRPVMGLPYNPPALSREEIQQLIAGMQLGTVDMAYLGVGNSGQLKGCGPLNVAYLPYLFKNKEKATQVLNGPIMQEFYESCAASSGVRVFAVAGARSPRAIVTTKGPIKKPEDLKGMRLRIPPIRLLSGGEIVEEGTHASLLAMGGLYARLAKLQFETGAAALRTRAAE